MTHPISVLIVDDSAAVRTAFSAIIKADPGLTLFGTAQDPFVAVERMRDDLPDAILLDIEMPRMDGLTFLKKIMAQCPVPVIVCSSHSQKGSMAAITALDLGAAEVLAKPDLTTTEARNRAALRIGQAVRAAVTERSDISSSPANTDEGRNDARVTPDKILAKRPAVRRGTSTPLVVIGSSTGGPDALRQVLTELPSNAPAIAIVQHMPAEFTGPLARRLNERCQIEVVEAKSGDPVTAGCALIAPGDQHLVIHREGRSYFAEVVGGPYVSRHRPSVDVLFRSAAQAAGENAMGMILTGMGDDGATCLGEIQECGGYTVAQNEASCVVYGMPRSAVEAGVVDKVTALKEMSGEIMKWHAGKFRKAV
ncbi:chemotaxis response regulator protein-glutamate methylesterase [Marivita sp. XM-24bin2]|jgi:two-component system chemotaxis response regulator CheB|uniref:protein-glutamate methylesterase/protein-glutamine glutaminase n=1 Tax=unclassified Marivita TaxID=2632480 RepID=UPI000D7B09BC|nr:chemotaxis response regulator protein-glutamate methylesterase [Marivita sp. XM-24bin2]MCR9108909.1 chemotaxis response regulator protein-glutamate methylesterase [Paracoccaceae bacterium]PWL34965.1 MAG: chemotaxis response regulator protein-glutamate methylesterase [Marivita sp. XM-24bin2]